jgi:hypothetical protein
MHACVRAFTCDERVCAAHAVTFGILSATSKLVKGESKGWSEVCALLV